MNSIVEIAKEDGFKISPDELQRAQAELSDEELERVAGGERQLDVGQAIFSALLFGICS